MVKAYRFATDILGFFMPVWLWVRKLKGKEDSVRMKERYGFASIPRPAGMLVWLHAASVGEANSVLPFIQKIRVQFPHVHVLLTTGTVTSAKLMRARLPKEVMHQYVPIDTPAATRRFIRHWKPDVALWVESEFWPNLVFAAQSYECFMCVINARMSERSYVFWKRCPALMRAMLACFQYVITQTEEDASRLRELGAGEMVTLGNIKYDGDMLGCDEAELLALKTTVGTRPIWLAASTHPGEEEIIEKTHRLLCATRPHLLTVIVPRHPDRGAQIAAKLPGAALRSKKEAVASGTAFYVADTLGELGLFYRLTPLVFMGGSLVKHGGQNPLEPARLSCAVVTGPYVHNFADVYQDMERADACKRVATAAALAAQIDQLLHHQAALHALQKAAKKWVESKSGATAALIDFLSPALVPRKSTL